MLLAVLFFMSLFATLALFLLLVSGGQSREQQQVLTRLQRISQQETAYTVLTDGVIEVRRNEVLSGVPWLDEWLGKMQVIRKLKLILYQADLKWTPARLLGICALTGIVFAYLVYWRTHGAFLSFVLGLLGAAIPLMWVFREREKRFYRLKEGLPEALDLMVSAMRAGHSYSSAMGMASRESPEPVKSEFRQCYDEQNYGLDLRLAMNNLIRRAPIREIRMISAAVLIQKDSGGNLTEILEKVSMLIREDFRLQRQVRVHTAQGRLTGLVLSLLSPTLGIALYMVSPDQMSILWRTQVGIRLLEGSIVMGLIGALVIRKIVRIQI